MVTPHNRRKHALGAGDGSDDVDAAPHETKKRVPSYKLRKEEAEELHAEVKALEAQLLVLQKRLGALDATGSALDASRVEVELQNARLRRAIACQQLALANTQSMMLQCIENQYSNPLCARVHLPRDRDRRRQTIVGLKDDQFARVYEYISARGRHLNLSKPHFSEERFEDANGSSCCLRYEVVQFEGVQSLRQVFDALVFFLSNMEISISETLGDITVREDYDSVDGDALISNHRLISGDVSGATIEMNAIAFGQYFSGGDANAQAPYAIGSTIAVDEDDLYPYHPNERIRKDVSAGVLLTELKRKRQSVGRDLTVANGQDEGLVVVLQRAAFIRHPRPPFELSTQTLKQLQDGIVRWGDVMFKSMRATLYSGN